MTVVTYLMEGGFRATRHQEGCGVLRRAQLEADGSQSRTWGRGRRKRGYTALRLFSEEEWRRWPGSTQPKDHTCLVAGVQARVL